MAAIGPQYNFGVGQLILIDNSAATPTPVNVGTLKEVSLDISRDVKELYGANMAAEDIALGKMKISGKAKTGRIQSALIAALLAGSTVATGQTAAANNEVATIPATPFTVTVVNATTWVQDGGVYDYTAGIWLKRVASAPATGQYSVSAGAYLFAAADTGHQVGIYYSYTMTTGVKTALTNQLMGSAISFQLLVFNTYKGKATGYKLFSVTFPKLGFGDKAEDHREIDLDFQASADASGNLIELYSAV